MAIRAVCIGINRHAHSGVRDLTGATRDATALWALLSDSIPSIDARLLTDNAATVQRVRRAFDETLGTADPGDVVIVSFSGHGTHDHRLVAHDTDIGDLPGTSIPMADVATYFRRSMAGVILCILDCCFSGEAPARVLADSPTPRDPVDPLSSVAGRGRILLAASSPNEPAWELPGTGHGLLTKALLDVFQSSSGHVSLPGAMGEILDRVRADAARLGLIQTPVLLGHVEGGLLLPALTRGTHYAAAFPDTRFPSVTSNIRDLASYNIPEHVLTAWQGRFTEGLNDLQLAAINERGVMAGSSVLVIAPTSAGKTFIGEMAAARAVNDGRKSIFLLPYRALVNEKYDQFRQLYGQQLDMRVIRCTGDYQDEISSFVAGKYDLALMTYEMFLSLAVGNPATLNQLGLVVLDEAQFITDPTRGITVELLLTLLLTAREKGIAPQLVVLSAVIGHPNSFDAWTGCDLLQTYERPVPLAEGVLDRTGTLQSLQPNGRIDLTGLLPSAEIYVRRDKPSAQDVIVPLVRKLVQAGEKVIIFRNRRGPAEGCAAYLAREIGLASADDAIAALPAHDSSTTANRLNACLAGGTAFHNSNLTREERIVVEQAFRDPDSNVRVLAATTTVAAGINTPASTVVLAEQDFLGEDGRPFTVAEYKNMAGRAGRLGFSEQGKSIILANTPNERESLFRRYVSAEAEPLQSSFQADQLDTWLIRLLSHVDHLDRSQVIGLLANTYGGYLATRADPNWQQAMTARVNELLSRMLHLRLLEEDQGKVRLTLLGRACGRSFLPFESILRLVQLLQRTPPEQLDPERLMALVQVLPESDGGYTPIMKRGRLEATRPTEAAQRFGTNVVHLLQAFARDQFDYYARCKRASLLWDWTQGVPVQEIERRYSPNPFQGTITLGDIRRFADTTRFHLRAAHEIASFIYVGTELNEEAMDTLLRQLEVGIPADAVGLLALPISLTRGEYLALREAGITDAQAVWALPPDTLFQTVGRGSAARLEVVRPALAKGH